MLSVECHCTQSRRVARRLTDLYDAELAPSGLKVTQFSLLRMVARLGEPTITALAEATGLDRSTLGRNLKVLAQMDLVTLGSGRDERTRLVSLSAVGRASIGAAEPLWRQAQMKAASLLPPETLAAIASAANSIKPSD